MHGKVGCHRKNAEIEKLSSTNKKIKPFKSDILQLTADELNYSLCLFVKEVKKPNGSEYAPDTIYYLCLGIQQYLFENGRIDNIFTDSYYEPFTDSLDEVAKKFADIFNDHHYIVTRVEEEHLWESKQLGAYSPHTLLSTLIFFNTKHFNLTNVEEHLMLSFSHIMKHWKRNPNQQASGGGGKAPGSRNVLLRFYPPQALLDDPNSKKKKVYEQQENEENPLRCPVKLYEFYLTKCPESVRTRSDVFYLQPERSCVPDSPVWYSTMALSKELLEKMLNRVKMVKEINIAMLTP
ncbi:zinc finger MYM-type protein 3-like [Homalodisca vitripennis]|uniref:zinc finger MYM-type protein 3-like n=1 Tax=Homalodisca vitripennis TaxID=197043 RepID=UPI001EE9F2C2|nr:zinc finger MYM-type protein 3-like [Homalodisca vitripennis]